MDTSHTSRSPFRVEAIARFVTDPQEVRTNPRSRNNCQGREREAEQAHQPLDNGIMGEGVDRPDNGLSAGGEQRPKMESPELRMVSKASEATRLRRGVCAVWRMYAQRLEKPSVHESHEPLTKRIIPSAMLRRGVPV